MYSRFGYVYLWNNFVVNIYNVMFCFKIMIIKLCEFKFGFLQFNMILVLIYGVDRKISYR